MSFEDLGLSPEVLKAVTECGYTDPTPIQEQAIPPILMTRDVLGLAQTGTGKTAGFILPMIEILAGGRAKARMPRSLVLAPTRELAAQVAENFDQYGKYVKLEKALLVGGESVAEQTRILDKGVDVLIATPGRLLDLFERGAVLLNDIKVLVIDEADRMLDMGFIPDIEKIISFVPPLRQTLLFSATMPKEIKGLADKLLSNPKEVSVAPAASPAETVKQFLVWSPKNRKRETLDKLIRQEDVKNAFIFCNRKRDIDGLARWLKQKGYAVDALHGDMQQSKRYEVLGRFKQGEVSLLICSDVAARGLDVEAMSHVFNYDVPMSADDYVHRIGRTGRAGMTGRAWTIAVSSGDDVKYVKAIERLIKREIPVESPDGGDQKKPKKKQADSGDKKSDHKGGDKQKRGGQKQKGQNRQQEDPQRQKAAPKQDKQKQQGKKHQGGDRKGGGKKVTGFGDEVPDFFGH